MAVAVKRQLQLVVGHRLVPRGLRQRHAHQPLHAKLGAVLAQHVVPVGALLRHRGGGGEAPG